MHEDHFQPKHNTDIGESGPDLRINVACMNSVMTLWSHNLHNFLELHTLVNYSQHGFLPLAVYNRSDHMHDIVV